MPNIVLIDDTQKNLTELHDATIAHLAGRDLEVRTWLPSADDGNAEEGFGQHVDGDTVLVVSRVTECLVYSAASMLLRSASAAAQSFDSKPMAVLVPTKSAPFGKQYVRKIPLYVLRRREATAKR